ncbi:MAG: endonuclease III domain-containing protein [Nitrospirae bacterium]|nr:endonuclease III domain-containing protein [Nitrospirota bacterium]
MKKKSGEYLKTVLNKIYKRLYRSFGPQHWWPGDTPFEVAIGAILTQNTNWGNVEKAIGNIKRKRLMDANKLYSLSTEDLSELIRPAGYFRVKAKRLREFLGFLINHCRGSMKEMSKGDLKTLRHKLLSVNGIGPETADSILLYSLNKPVFVIDAYTRRVLSRHNIVSEKATYHEMQELFHKNLPVDVRLFNEYHALFVKVGKEYCKPRPLCTECPLNELNSKRERSQSKAKRRN